MWYNWRSLLADIIQPQDLKELCSVLVVVSSEAGKTLAGIGDSNFSSKFRIIKANTSLWLIMHVSICALVWLLMIILSSIWNATQFPFFFFEEIILFYAEQEILEEDIHGKLKHIIRFLLISGCKLLLLVYIVHKLAFF